MEPNSDGSMMTRTGTINLEDSSQAQQHQTSTRPRGDPNAHFPRTPEPAQRPAVASGGWGFDGDGTQPKIKVPTQEKHFKEDDDEVIPLIPDLEEEADEDITRQVAAPPVAATFQPQKVPNLRDLDNEVYGNEKSQQPGGSGLSTSPEEGVDLSILLQVLCPQKSLIEEDVVWDHDQLFHEVTSYVTKEREEADGDTAGGGGMNVGDSSPAGGNAP